MMNAHDAAKMRGPALQRQFDRIHAFRMRQRDEALHHPARLVANRRRRMLETTALRSPIGGAILRYTELVARRSLP